jgi:hypothetical protein
MGSDNHVVVSHKLWFSGTIGQAMQCMFKLSVKDLLANSITDPSSVCEAIDCSSMVFVDEFSNFFNILLSIWWCLVALNVRHLQLTLDQP